MTKLQTLLIVFVFLLSPVYGQEQGRVPFFNGTVRSVGPVEGRGFASELNEPFLSPHDEVFPVERGDGAGIPVSTPGNRPLSLRERHTLQAIIQDFQVNENAGPNGARQYTPAVAVDGSGSFIVVWEDRRNIDGDIYARRYAADGTPLGANFRVNDDSGGAGQRSPAVAVDGSGNVVVVWTDERSDPNGDIYAQRYAADGSPLGANFRVNDDSGGARQWSPAVAVDGSGNVAVVWTDGRQGDRDIYGQRFASDGGPLGVNFRINDDSGRARQWRPAVAADGSGNVMVVWEDERNDTYGDIYAQRYAADGSPVGANVKVNDDSGRAGQGSPAVAVDGSGNVVVVWTDERNGDQDVYAQRYAAGGTPLGANFMISDDSGGARQYSPAVAVDDSGNVVVAWTDHRSDTFGDIYVQRYAADGSPLGVNFKVNDDSGRARQGWSAVAVDGSGNVVVVWADYRRDYYGDIYAQRYAPDGSPLGSNFEVNDDSGSAGQGSPAVAVDDSGNVVVVWTDDRNDPDGDIYAQRYAVDGTPLEANFRVNDDSGRASQWSPAVAADGSGNIVVVWTDGRHGDGDIYAQRYAADGTPLGANFKVNDDNSGAWQRTPAVAMDGPGNVVVVWKDQRHDYGDIYLQRYADDGTPLGANVRVNDDNSGTMQGWPAVAVDDSGDVVVVWTDGRNGDADIYAQRYAADGNPLEANFRVNDDSGAAVQGSPAVAVDGSGNVVVVWEDGRHGDGDIYVQRYLANGSPLGANFKVNDDQGGAEQGRPAVAVDGSGNVVVVWTDERQGDRDIYAQRFSSDGSVMGQNFIITLETKKAQFDPDVKLWQGRIYNTWVSNHAGGTGYDIWANVLDWSNPTGMERKPKSVITAFRLFQNYPNPFNPTTTIRYALPGSVPVELTVYNLLGQKVRTLVHRRQPAGRYQVQWDGRDDQGKPVASGVYLYRLRAGSDFTRTKTMLLLR